MKSVVALMLFVTSVAAFAEVKVETDKFTGKTEYSTPSIPLLNTFVPKAAVIVSDGESAAALYLTGGFYRSKYSECEHIEWLLDGKPVQFPPAEYNSEITNEGFILKQFIYTLLPIEKLKAIANASVVEYRICNDKYKFDETTLSNFRELWSKFATAKYAEVKVKTDKFTGKTTYSTPFIAQTDTITPVAIITVSDGKMMPGFDLRMTGVFRHWKYIKCNNIHWLLDGKPVQFPPAEYRGNILAGGKGVTEHFIYLLLPIEKLKAIASASVVEYKICNDEYKFDETTLLNFRELLSKSATAK